METIVYKWLTFTLPTISALVSWFASRRVRNNSTLQQLQSSIDLLAKKNSELYALVMQQNTQIVKLKVENEELKQQVSESTRVIGELRKELQNIKLPKKK